MNKSVDGGAGGGIGEDVRARLGAGMWVAASLPPGVANRLTTGATCFGLHPPKKRY